MKQKPNTQLSTRQIAIGAGLGALIGILLGAVASNLLGGTLPWAAIGAGVGTPIGLGVSYILMNRPKDK